MESRGGIAVRTTTQCGNGEAAIVRFVAEFMIKRAAGGCGDGIIGPWGHSGFGVGDGEPNCDKDTQRSAGKLQTLSRI